MSVDRTRAMLCGTRIRVLIAELEIAVETIRWRAAVVARERRRQVVVIVRFAGVRWLSNSLARDTRSMEAVLLEPPTLFPSEAL
jgi:hypothetical protein